MGMERRPAMDNASRFESLRRASMISAVLMILSALIVLGSSWFSYNQLRDRQAEVAKLGREAKELKQVADSMRTSNSTLRGALTATRLAINAFQSHEYGTAIELYDESLAADPDDAYVLNLKAYALFKMNRVKEALEVEKRSVKADSSYAWGYFDLARFHFALNQLKEGLSAEAKMLRLDPRFQNKMRTDGEYQRHRRNAQNSH
jgi:tetratricopeptide (TPR) repeat protein